MVARALVCGAGGFIGSHLVKRLKSEGFWVRGVDLKRPEFGETQADDFIVGDLRRPDLVRSLFDKEYEEVYQLAADMGGAGYIFTGEHDADVMHNSAMINLNMLEQAAETRRVGRIFYSSSACIYPLYNQLDPQNPKCSEDSAYPAAPDSEYGWEKLFSERLYEAFFRNYNIECRVARFHNIFGPEGSWNNGKEKAPAALCRKIASVEPGSAIEIWGDGEQTRSFLYIDDCVDAMLALTRSNFRGPVNIGSEELISINDLAWLIGTISGKDFKIQNVSGPVGVRGRVSDNAMINEKLGWQPKKSLREGLIPTYEWIHGQIVSEKSRRAA